MEELIRTIVERKRLENRYGHVSCFDVPHAYDRMAELADEARERAEKLAEECGCLPSAIMEVAEMVADDIANGNLPEVIEISIHDMDGYIETYIVDTLDEQARNVFDSLFYWMSADERAHWLARNYTDHDPYTYTSRRLDCIAVVDA